MEVYKGGPNPPCAQSRMARTAREHEALMARNMMSNHTCSDRPKATEAGNFQGPHRRYFSGLLSGTSKRIRRTATCRNRPERCDRHEVGAFHVSPTHHSLLVPSSSATSATARRSPQEGAEPAFSQAATVFIRHPPRFRVSK